MKIAVAVIFSFLCLIVYQSSPQADEAPVSTSGKSLDEIADILKNKLQNQQQNDEKVEAVEKTGQKKDVIYKYQDERGQWHFAGNFYSIPERYRKSVIEVQKQKNQPATSVTRTPAAEDDSSQNSQVIYKYRDERGQWHFTGSRQSIPERYLKNVIEVPVQKSKSDQPYRQQNYQENSDYKSSPLMKEIEQRESEGKQWREQWLRLKQDFEEKQKVYESIKDIPPDCTMTYLGYSPAPVDPRNANCEENWKVLIEKARIEMQEAQSRLDEYKEKARRAGIAPGYLR